MVIFNSYVKLPEGRYDIPFIDPSRNPTPDHGDTPQRGTRPLTVWVSVVVEPEKSGDDLWITRQSWEIHTQ